METHRPRLWTTSRGGQRLFGIVRKYPWCILCPIWTGTTIAWYLARIRGSPRIMARLDMTVENNLDKRFRAAVYKKYGMKKGSIKTAVEEAILLWLKEGKKWACSEPVSHSRTSATSCLRRDSIRPVIRLQEYHLGGAEIKSDITNYSCMDEWFIRDDHNQGSQYATVR